MRFIDASTHPARRPSRPLLMTVPGPWLQVRGRRISWFHVCGAAAALSWVAALLTGAHLRGLPVAPLVIITATAGATFLIVVTVTALLLGEGRLTWYHHQLAVLTTTSTVLWVRHWPLLPYLDLVGTGLMAFTIFGRLGCLLVGCCHGRPARCGVIYGPAHVDAGLSPAHIGIPLRPVQLMEAMVAAVLTIGCLAALAIGAPAGTAVGLALAGYALARFWLETSRGDRRPHAAGQSEAQWTATATATVLLLICLTGAPWLSLPTAVLAAAVVLSAAVHLSPVARVERARPAWGSASSRAS